MSNISVLVGSCDKYSFLWDDFAYFFRSRWDNSIDAPVYLISEEKEFNDRCFINIRTGDTSISYTQSLRKALNLIDTDYIFWLQDDYFLMQTISREWIDHNLRLISRYSIDRINFQKPGNKLSLNEDDTLDSGRLVRVSQYSDFTISMQPGIWNRRFF